MSWISIPGWRRFQHYDPEKRQPPWIKTYTDLLDNEEWLALTPRLRGILVGIWLAYAASRSQLGSSPARIGLRIGDTSVRARDIQALCDAGFLAIVASKELAEGYHTASSHAHATDLETETDVETEEDLDPEPVPTSEPTPPTNHRDVWVDERERPAVTFPVAETEGVLRSV